MVRVNVIIINVYRLKTNWSEIDARDELKKRIVSKFGIGNSVLGEFHFNNYQSSAFLTTYFDCFK